MQFETGRTGYDTNAPKDTDNEQLKRIANALEEVLRLVKEDQERTRKYMEEKKDE